MKTFLWTSLFWIVAAIAGLLCLGFGNLGTQVLDNARLAKVMPENVQTLACDYESAIASAMEGVDWCATAQDYDCYYGNVDENAENEENINAQDLLDSLNILSANQETIYNQMNESFATVLENISTLANQLQNYGEVEIEDTEFDEREAQRLQIQAQIEALQNEMANL